jgi:small subunit ribosomal protein S18
MIKKTKRPRRSFRSNLFRTPRGCRLCKDKVKTIDYKQIDLISKFVTERGKMIPSRISGNCAIHQRKIARAVKRARIAGLLQFVGE